MIPEFAIREWGEQVPWTESKENHHLQQGKEKNEIQKNDSMIHNAWDIAGG